MTEKIRNCDQCGKELIPQRHIKVKIIEHSSGLYDGQPLRKFKLRFCNHKCLSNWSLWKDNELVAVERY